MSTFGSAHALRMAAVVGACSALSLLLMLLCCAVLCCAVAARSFRSKGGRVREKNSACASCDHRSSPVRPLWVKMADSASPPPPPPRPLRLNLAQLPPPPVAPPSNVPSAVMIAAATAAAAAAASKTAILSPCMRFMFLFRVSFFGLGSLLVCAASSGPPPTGTLRGGAHAPVSAQLTRYLPPPPFPIFSHPRPVAFQ